MQNIFAPDLFQRRRNPKLKEHDAYSLFRWPFGAPPSPSQPQRLPRTGQSDAQACSALANTGCGAF